MFSKGRKERARNFGKARDLEKISRKRKLRISGFLEKR